MKKILILTTALIGNAAMAETPNRTTMSFEEFVQASGCYIADNAAGQSNLYAADGGACPTAVLTAFIGKNSKVDAGVDGISGTADDRNISDN